MRHYFTNNYDTKSNESEIIFDFYTTHLTFVVDNGVFSKRYVDFGTRLLLNCLVKKDIKGKILDIGCGYGVIGISLAKAFDCNVHMTDVNKRCLELTEKNGILNSVTPVVYESDAYEAITETFDYIITNPPIRAGKEVVYKIILGAKDHLTKDGELWIVIRKQQGAKSLIKDMAKYFNTQVIEKDSGYYILMAKTLDK